MYTFSRKLFNGNTYLYINFISCSIFRRLKYEFLGSNASSISVSKLVYLLSQRIFTEEIA